MSVVLPGSPEHTDQQTVTTYAYSLHSDGVPDLDLFSVELPENDFATAARSIAVRIGRLTLKSCAVQLR